MARASVGGEKLLVRFGDGTMKRIDAVSENRSEFVRGAVEAALSGVCSGVEAVRSLSEVEVIADAEIAKSVLGEVSDRVVALLQLRKRLTTERYMCDALDLQSGVVTRAVKELADAGLVRYSNGGVELV